MFERNTWVPLLLHRLTLYTFFYEYRHVKDKFFPSVKVANNIIDALMIKLQALRDTDTHFVSNTSLSNNFSTCV